MPQLLPAAQHPPLERPVADCRIYERKECAVPTMCQPASALDMREMRWAATIADISQGGVRILLQRRFEKGTGLAIELPGDGVREPTVVFVRVVHVRAHPGASWALGCRFVSELSDDEMHRLLTSTHHVLSAGKPDYLEDGADEDAAARARPQELRYLTNVFLQVDGPTGSVTECMVKRLNVTKCWPLAAGKVLSLNGKTGDQAPWSLRIQITQCCQHAKGWEIQGRVVGPTTASGVQRTIGS